MVHIIYEKSYRSSEPSIRPPPRMDYILPSKLQSTKMMILKSTSAMVILTCKLCNMSSIRIRVPLHKRFTDFKVRPVDGSTVINVQKYELRHSLKSSPPKYIKREKGLELQFRFHCARCNACLLYTSTQSHMNRKFMYIMTDALSYCRQGDFVPKPKPVILQLNEKKK